MLLIHCPYCDEDRARARVRLCRRGAYRPPAGPVGADRRGVARLPLHPLQSRAASISSAGGTSTAAAASSTRCATPSPTGSLSTYKAGEPRPDVANLDWRGQRMTTYRLPHRGRDRSRQARPLHLRRQGYAGFAGDTLASALLANGVHLVGRSFKYHRPRGMVSAGSEEPNALDRHPPRPRPLRAEHPRHQVGAPRRPRGDQPEPLAVARASMSGAINDRARHRCSRPASTTRPSCGREPSGTRSTSRSSAAPPASASRADASPMPTAMPAASPTATCWSSAPARPASPRRSPPAAPAPR